MTNQFQLIFNYMVDSFKHIWPYLLISIPLAVAVSMTEAGKHINKIFTEKPIVAILLAVAAGAFSPFCSCGVIPIIASLLISGVPLAPVMAFWVASPSMDPEIFFLSAGFLGWELATWRFLSTLIISLGAGLITHFAVVKNLLGNDILQYKGIPNVSSTASMVKKGWNFLKVQLNRINVILWKKNLALVIAYTNGNQLIIKQPSSGFDTKPSACGEGSCRKPDGNENTPGIQTRDTFLTRLAKEIYLAVAMVIKFMALAFLLGALINLYIPQDLITKLLGGTSFFTVITAAVLGVPVYTSNLTALPLIGGLLNQGMNPAAALAFLISGPTTTIPAMAAVWGLVNRKVANSE